MEDTKREQTLVVSEIGKEEKDEGSYWWGLLGFCWPVIGLILYLVWSNKKPRSAKGAGIGALIPVLLVILFLIVSIFLPNERDVYSKDGAFSLTRSPGWKNTTSEIREKDLVMALENTTEDSGIFIYSLKREDTEWEFDEYAKAYAREQLGEPGSLRLGPSKELEPINLNGLHAYTLEKNMYIALYDIYYWIYLIETEDAFYRVLGWSDYSAREERGPEIAALIQTFTLQKDSI